MKRTTKVAVAFITLVGAFSITWFSYFPHSPLGKQLANMKLAEEHCPPIMERLSRIQGAEKVQAVPYTGLGGSMVVHGHVGDEQTAEAVMAEVLANPPPLTVSFELIVGETNMIRKVARPDNSPR
jgi:hypothetical protein